MNTLLQAVQESSYRIMIIVFMFTGLRESELLGLMWDCVDFDRGSILIDKQLNKSQRKEGGYSFNPTKNGKSRLIVPAPYVMELLREQRDSPEAHGTTRTTWSLPMNLDATFPFVPCMIASSGS